VARVIQKSPFVANVPPEESREQGLGPTDPEQESGLPPLRLTGGWDGHLERSKSAIKKFYSEFCKKKVLQLKIPEEIITLKLVHTALNAFKPTETILQAAATPLPLSQKQGQRGSLLKFNPTYDKIPNPLQEMWEVNLPKPDDPLNPEKWEVGCKIPHLESVRQGPSTAIGVPDLRSKKGEFQHKTAQSLRRSTAAAPAATVSDRSANLTPGGAHGPSPGNRRRGLRPPC